MQTFGRVLAGCGVALAAIGAIATLPPPELENAGGHLGERRQAPRQPLRDTPEAGDLITGISEPDCAAWALLGTGNAPGCAAEDPPGDPGELLFQSNEASRRFRAPAPGSGTQ